eukprot:1153043-Pelagomonas_calceolata.AAC.3
MAIILNIWQLWIMAMQFLCIPVVNLHATEHSLTCLMAVHAVYTRILGNGNWLQTLYSRQLSFFLDMVLYRFDDCACSDTALCAESGPYGGADSAGHIALPLPL